MKKLLIIMLWMFLGVSSTMAQWAELTTGTTVNLNGLQFTDNNHGFCIGDGGIFLHTNDGGSTWNTKTFFTSENFQKLHFVNNNLGFICSDNHLYKTTDGGANFTEITNLLRMPPMNYILPSPNLLLNFVANL